MHCGEDDSPPYIQSYNGVYSSSLASSASASSASVWSDASSQVSDDSSVTSASSEVDEEYCLPQVPLSLDNVLTYGETTTATITASTTNVATQWSQGKVSTEVVSERRRTRRTSASHTARPGFPPSLVRQSDRKVNFVDNLVDTSAQIVESIWPLSSVACKAEMGNKGVLPLRTFIQETLRRSRTSYSTLQVALYYLILIKPHVPTYDFTMEQPDCTQSTRALQCGRRMFLSALILASKYLQDRNYSARAWSKISGLNTLEINQNEMTFLLAVNWQMHITEAVFQRWTDIVLKYIPAHSPAPSSSCTRLSDFKSVDTWKSVIRSLEPGLEHTEHLCATTSVPVSLTAYPSTPESSYSPMAKDDHVFGYGSREATPTSRHHTPKFMEPSPMSAYPANKAAPALGLLPTPRLTPQTSAYSTPAVSAKPSLAKSSMSLAMAYASNMCIAQYTERWQQASSPVVCFGNRRSSLAASVSSVFSPESLVSDTSSRSSRSSSISSASSLMSAPTSSRMDVQVRCRYAKLCSEKMFRPSVATVRESYSVDSLSSSPDSYTGPIGKDLLDMSLETPSSRCGSETDYFFKDEEAVARALQDLHNQPRSSRCSLSKAGAKRSRTDSLGSSLQENVREMLSGRHQSASSWSSELVRSHSSVTLSGATQVAVRSSPSASKRVCCSTEALSEFAQPALPYGLNLCGPGMWRDVLE